MNLSEQGNMFAETSSLGENIGEINEESYVTDLDLVIGKLSVSPTPYESSSVGADGSSLSMVKAEVSGADLLSAFDSISATERLEPRGDVATDSIKADAFDSIGQADPRTDEGKYTSKFDSSHLPGIAEPSTERDGKAEVLVGIDKTCERNHSLIVYSSSRRRSACNTKLNQNHESPKPSRRRRIANKKSVDLSSLQILRRSRSSLSKKARSSVWGHLGNMFPDSKVNSGVDLNLGNDRKPRKMRGGKGKRNAIMDQTCQKSTGKKCIPTGHISLKIKIGNKSCSIGTATENFSASGKDIPKLLDKGENKLGEKVPGDMVSPRERNMEKVMLFDASALTTHVDSRGASDNPSFSVSSDFHQIISQEEGDTLGASTENRCSDTGTSPDSEVINSVPDAPLCEKGLPDIQGSPIMSKASVSPSDVPDLILSQKKSKKGKKKDKVHWGGDYTLESKLSGAETTSNAKVPVPVGDVSSRPTSKKGKKKNKIHEVGDCSVENKLIGAETTNTAQECGESQECDTLITCNDVRKSPKCSRAKGGSKGRSRILDLPSKKDKVSKNKGNKNDVGGKHQVNEKVDADGLLSGVVATGNRPSDLGETRALSKDLIEPVNSLQFSPSEVRGRYITPRNAWVLCDECQKWRRIPAILADQIEETNCGWTCKDNMDKDFAECSIPQEKSNSEINEELEISDEDACDAFMKSNQNRPKVPQQSSWSLIKSNLFLHRSRKTQTIDEVMVCHCKPPSDGRIGCGAKCLNRMLNIECVRGTCPCGELCSNQQFQRRKYAKLKWFRCGKKGYGLQALENISEGQFLTEYVGEVLDVHTYEARQREYALNGHKHFYFMTLNGSEVIDACAKGNLGRFINHSCDPNCRTEKWMVNGEVCVGLFALRDIKKGEEVTFDYNYVRVFGAAAKKCVCGSPNCRGYIGGDPTNSEVIVQDDSDDEYAEPVMICEDREMNGDWNDIMLNSLKDKENEIANEPPENNKVKKLISAVGESIREPNTSETLAQNVEGVKSEQVLETTVRDRFQVGNSDGNDSAANAVEQLDITKITGKSRKGPASATVKVESEGLQSRMQSSPQLMDISLQSDDIVNKVMSSGHESAGTTATSISLSDAVESRRKLKYATTEGGSDELAKSNSLAKANRSPSSIKKGKLKTKVMNIKATPDIDRLNAALHKSKKLPELPLNSHFEAVEEKLNELLDPEGGISKRKDASRGYLKLLFLTAASGNNGNGEAIQSNRDLSMILDALLKTKSRTVLVDIINKNGLQMLHNIMKRYRKEFIKTPILRKLLKVLEYLAMREILTLEHITGGPPCPGVESFKDSILILTEHADRKVHQIARNFRDRWIPRSLRRNCCVERDDGRIEFHQRSSHSGLSVPYDHWGDRAGKSSEMMNSGGTQSVGGRSSETTNSGGTLPVAAPTTVETSSIDLLSATGSNCATNGTKTRKRKSRWDNPVEEPPQSRSRTNLAGDGKLDIDEDFPPGFASPCSVPKAPSDASPTATNHQENEMHINQHPLDTILGDPQLRFDAHLPVSYGVSYSVMQQFGAIEAGRSEGWTIAPGVPFHPFPPLPPYPRAVRDQPTSAARSASLSEPAEKAENRTDTCTPYHTVQNKSSTCNTNLPEKSVPIPNGRPDFQQGGSSGLGRPDFQQGDSNSLGRKYFRQQKWNNSKLAPPWVRMRNGWGYAGSNIRNGSPGVGLGNGTNEFRNSYNSEELNWRGGL